MNFKEAFLDPKISITKIAHHFNVTKTTIVRWGNEAGLNNPRPKSDNRSGSQSLVKIDKVEYLKIKDLFELDKLSVKEISQLYNVTAMTISRILKSLNIILVGNKGKTKHKINHDYFKTLTQKKARILGLLATDGDISYTKTGNIRIRFSSKDNELVNFVKSEIGGTIYQEIGCKRNYILSTEIGKDLFTYGITQNKSLNLTVNWDKIRDFKDHFLVGIIEGDGYICFSDVKNKCYINIATGSKSFADQIQLEYPEFSSIYKKIQEKKNSNDINFGTTYYPQITNFKNLLEICNKLKKASNECGMLSRKLNLIESILSKKI